VTRELKENSSFLFFHPKTRHGSRTGDREPVIEEHHGSIRVEENQPVGARFIVELPVVPEPALVISTVQHA